MVYPKFRICVRCFTFNHSNYIKDALDGFSMQKTDFPYVCCIVDDASTDGEQEIIDQYLKDNFILTNESTSYTKETDYANIVYAQHKDNDNCFFAILYLKENHYSLKKTKIGYLKEWRDICEYEAICEGDDYWISTNKLSLQVKYMDQHRDCGLCYTNFHRRYDCSKRFDLNVFHSSNSGIYPYSEIPESVVLKGSFFCPPSWLYRISLFRNKPNIKTLDGSFVLFVHAICMSKVYFLDEVTTIYRVSHESATHSKNPVKIYEREESLLKTKLELIRYYNLDPLYSEKIVINYFNRNVFFLISLDKTKDILEHRLYPCFSKRTRFLSKIARIRRIQQILMFFYKKTKILI